MHTKLCVYIKRRHILFLLRILQCCPIGFGLHEWSVSCQHHPYVPIICFHLQTRPHCFELQYFYFILFYLFYFIFLFSNIIIVSLKPNYIFANSTVVVNTETQKTLFLFTLTLASYGWCPILQSFKIFLGQAL